MQNTLSENWRAGYAERCKSGSEGSSAKPNTAMCHGRVVLTLLFIAGTIENSLGERESHRVGKSQVVATPYALEREDNLHRIAREQMEQVLDRTIGLEWRELRPPDPEPKSPEHQTIWDELMADVTTDTPQPQEPKLEPPSIQPSTPSLDLEL